MPTLAARAAAFFESVLADAHERGLVERILANRETQAGIIAVSNFRSEKRGSKTLTAGEIPAVSV